MRKILKSKKFKITIGVVLSVIVLLVAGFFIYVSDYYHALPDYDTKDVIVADYDGFTIYGNTMSEKGLIFYPGGKVEESAYEPLLCELAEQGICCVLVKMPFRLAVLNSNAADRVIAQVTTVKQWYISGHSLGGVMAANYAAANEDKIDGVIMLAAYPTKIITANIPVLSLTGSNDQVLNIEKYKKSVSNAHNLKEITIQGGNHGNFGNYGAQKGDGEADITPEQQWRLTSSAITEFIEDN